MVDNKQIERFLAEGIRRFSEKGIEGIRVNKICREVGVAKSSFYHYFGNKQGYLKQLFDHWYEISRGSIHEKIKHINDGAARFKALKQIIDSNEEEEYFYLQLKLYASTNKLAQKVVDKAKQKRYDVLYEIFTMAGQAHEEAVCNVKKMILFYFGRLALTHGYAGDTSDFDIREEELMRVLGLEK